MFSHPFNSRSWVLRAWCLPLLLSPALDHPPNGDVSTRMRTLGTNTQALTRPALRRTCSHRRTQGCPCVWPSTVVRHIRPLCQGERVWGHWRKEGTWGIWTKNSTWKTRCRRDLSCAAHGNKRLWWCPHQKVSGSFHSPMHWYYVRMYVTMYVCMYICKYICMYVWMQVSMYQCMYACVGGCLHVWVCLHMYLDI